MDELQRTGGNPVDGAGKEGLNHTYARAKGRQISGLGGNDKDLFGVSKESPLNLKSPISLRGQGVKVEPRMPTDRR